VSDAARGSDGWVEKMIRVSSGQVGPLFTSLRALSHPYSVAAAVTLAVNDHILKGLAPGWLTGKLSDFAGLFFFPYLLTLVSPWSAYPALISSALD
jgi:hypothetical protein